MSVFAISDLHLSLGCDKPMDVFGNKWFNYTDKMRENWNKVVSKEDYVIIPGDISWATYIQDAYLDFKYINELNGHKILLKGNHDYWWTTKNKMAVFFKENSFDTIDFIQNDSFIITTDEKKVAVCGTRGWNEPPKGSDGEDRKIYEREKQRLVLSLQNALDKHPDMIIGAMHYPPIEKGEEESPFTMIFKEYGVDLCVYGHLHAASQVSAPRGVCGGVDVKLVSCDYLNFVPKIILP